LRETILEAKKVEKHFPLRRGILDRFSRSEALKVRAVDDVGLSVGVDETLGLVGESGSGKTTLGRVVLLLEKPTSGQILFRGEDITNLRGEELRQIRKKMQIVFQNPNSSLDPRQRAKDIISEPLRAFKEKRERSIEDSVLHVLEAVGLPQDGLMRFPHEFSGGQRQRIAIARALVLNPEFLVLDEPTSALDSSVQAQILNLLRKLQEELGLSYLFITHNVNVVKYMADRIAVMYSGKLAEIGETREVLEHPLHPYTSALISAIPKADPEDRTERVNLKGEVPSSVQPPSGCRFHPRCPYAKEICSESEPELREVRRGHWSACHFAEEFTEGAVVRKGAG
jgi:peptide/nickel transport system ATP-binding protein